MNLIEAKALGVSRVKRPHWSDNEFIDLRKMEFSGPGVNLAMASDHVYIKSALAEDWVEVIDPEVAKVSEQLRKTSSELSKVRDDRNYWRLRALAAESKPALKGESKVQFIADEVNPTAHIKGRDIKFVKRQHRVMMGNTWLTANRGGDNPNDADGWHNVTEACTGGEFRSFYKRANATP